MRTKTFLLTPLAWASVAALAQTLPSGGSIVQGTGSVTVNGTAMVVQQNSARMVADWQSFSIGAANSVRFVQPSSSSVALNRVIGGDPSQIFGSLSANGHVYLQNPAGVLFAPGAQVNVGSLVATSLNADVGQFMAGQLRLSGNGPAGAVRNEGSLTAAEGGYVVLAAPQVANSGSITAPGGTAALAAGSAVEIDPTGSGLLSIRVPVAAVAAKLEQSGRISADGGLVALQAAATGAALDTVMQVGGVVRARSIESRDGQIVLSGGSSGVVRVDGTLDASGGAGLGGGTVKVLGERVALQGAARVDASGDRGGGTVLVGGNYQGRGPEANALVTVVGADTTIDASARGQGDGGKVIVWSDRATSFEGRIEARGGAQGGNGGFAEVSGKEHLNFAGDTDLRAPAGQQGTLLLDPSVLIVGTLADLNANGAFGDDLVTSPVLAADFAGSNFPSQITSARVATLLATGNVRLEATFQLSVTAPLTVAAGGFAGELFLQAPSVTVAAGAPMTLNNSALTIDTAQNFSDTIRINAPVQSLNAVTLTSTDIGINDVITTPQLTLVSPTGSFGVVNEGVAGGVVAGRLSTLISGEGGMNLTLDSANNRIGTLALNLSNANVVVSNPAATPVAVQGTVFGDLTLSSSGGIVQAAGAGGALLVSADTQVTTTGADAALLTNPANQFFGPLNFTTTGAIDLAAQGPLTATGRGTGDVRMTVGGPLTLGTAGINTTGALIDLTSAGFVDASDTGAALATGAGGRFFIRSSDFAADALGSIGFGVGANQVNHVLLGGWAGATPVAGNVYQTNAVASIATPAADVAPVTKAYDGNTAFAYTQTGTAATGTISTAPGGLIDLFGYTVTSTGAFADKNAGIDKAYTVAATNNVVGTGRGGEQYYGLAFAGFARPAGPGTALSSITPRAITSTGITAVNRVYDGTTAVALNTAGAALANTVAGDAVALTTSGATGTMANKNAGVAKAVAVGGLALTGADAGNYAVTDASNATVTITPRPLNALGVTAVNRVYDGTALVALNTSAATLTGVLPGDTVTAAGGSGTMANKNAGTAKPVSGGVVTLAGIDGANYTAAAVGTPTVDIAVRPITSTGITGVDRVYDGTTAVALNGSAATLGGAIAGDAVALSLAGASGTMADKNVGNAKPVAITGVTLAGADAPNYSLTEASTASVNISALALSAAGIRAVNRVVDGTTVVELDTSGAALPGVIGGDNVVLDASGASGAVSSPDAGRKPVTIAGLVLTGADAVNYAVLPTAIGADGGGLTVRILTVAQGAFEDVRFKEYLQGVSDAQEPFRRAMAEALAAGFGKENIRKQLSRGLVFETGLAAPAVDNIDSAARPGTCTGGATLGCGK